MATKQTIGNESWGRFDFLGPAKYITAFTIVLVAAALVLIATKGLNYGVDFAGGIEMQTQFTQSVEPARVRQFMSDSGYPNANVQALGKGQTEYLIRVESRGETEEQQNAFLSQTVEKIKTGLATAFAAEAPVVRRVDTVGPQVGAELKRNGMLAGFYCLLLILIYVGLRFDYRYAPGAVFCLFHDAIITVGIYSLLDWEFTTQTLAAVLTIIGYSLNDTIVIFDRIRENIPIHRDKPLYWISNRSINETLSRTVLTYITTCLALASMYFFADGVIQDFALTMLIGMFLGAYSTIYVATPLMLVADGMQKARRRKQLETARA